MKRALAIALLIASPTASPTALADGDDRPSAASVASSDKLVAIATTDDIDGAVLVGPSGQVYEPSGGGWTRAHGGGVAGDVAGAAFVAGALVVAGKALPVYRRDDDVWYALRVGERGRTVLGRGPTPALAVGADVHVRGKARWKKLGRVAGKPVAVWASGEKTVWVATDKGLFRLRGGSFTRAGEPADLLVGARPFALDPDGVRDLGGGAEIPAVVDGAAVTLVAGASHGQAPLHLVAAAGAEADAPLWLLRVDGKRLEKLAELPVTGRVVGLAVDGVGDALVVMADGTLAVRRGDAWSTSAVVDALPADAGGPAPARTR